MEDTVITLPALQLEGLRTGFFAVYDGHNGDGTALYLKKEVHCHIQGAWQKSAAVEVVERMESSLVEGFLEADKGALELMSLPGAVYSGSTAVSVAIVPADQATVLICANAGDCRAGVCQCT